MTQSRTSKSVYTEISLDPNARLIRLLEILDDEAGTIACRFHRVRLEDAPSYTALSYTWGSAKEAKKILVNGTWVSVRQNLWNFFQQTKRERRFRFLWIDALCIDQQNTVERNHQVSMMKAIYSSADIVTVWLGEATDDSDMAMRYIERLGKESFSVQRPCNWKQGRAVYALTERRYWKRIWIVQEIMLAKDILVLCGQRSVSWSCFSTLLNQLQLIHDYGRMEHIPFAWPVFRSAALRIVSKRSKWRSLPPETIGLPIENVLEDFSDLESTELKDKVYALLGIIQPFVDGSSILVDYSKTTAAIYRDVLRNVFYHNKVLDLPAKQRFKKSLKKSLGLGVINVMEREPATEAKILLAVEECAQMVIKRIETQATERFHSQMDGMKLSLLKEVKNEIGQHNWLTGQLLVGDWAVLTAIHETAVKPETISLVEGVAERELIAAMNITEPKLLAVFKDQLKDVYELGVETTMRWVQESRFEVESSRDEALDSKMEIQMMNMLTTQIERHLKHGIQSAMDSALKDTVTLARDQIRLMMSQLSGSVDDKWRQEYISVWIYKWRRREIVYDVSDNDRAIIEWWIDHWYERQANHLISQMSLMEMRRRFRSTYHYLMKRDERRRSRESVKGVVLECVQSWHQRTGILDISSAEIQEEIKEKIEASLRERYPLPDF